MARTVEDATRFTPNGPYASRPSARSTVLQFSDPAPANETAQQKIARLRAAAQRAKLAEVSTFEKAVKRGRTWADRAHRATVYGIITLSAVTGLVTVFSLTDMVIYNRNKRKGWLADVLAKREADLVVARKALAEGTLTQDQILLLNQERIAEEARIAKEQKAGIFKRTKDFLFGGLSKEEQQGGKLTGLTREGENEAQLGGSSQKTGEGLGILKAVEEQKTTQIGSQSVGGPLDRAADDATQAIKSTSKSWTSWIGGR